MLSIALDPRDPRVVYAAPNGGLVAGVYKSADGGLTWQEKNAGLPSVAEGRIAYQLALDPAAPDVVYADLGPYGIFRSDDGGEHWTATVLGGYPMAVGAGVVFTASNEVSFDGGATFQRTALEQTWNAQAIALDPRSSARVFVGAYQGIFRSQDGAATFQRVNRGLAATWIRNLQVDGAARPTLYAGVYGLDLEKRPSGGSWRSANLPAVGTGLAISPQAPSTLYTIDYSEIDKSVDAGASWEPIRFYNDGCFSIAQVTVDAHDPATVFAVGFEQSGRCPHDCYTFVSRDAGAHWTCMATLGGATSIAIDAQSPQTLYAANYDRTPWRSDDGGKHWARSGRGVPGRSFPFVAASPLQGGLIYAAAYPPGVFTSTDGGRTFGKPGLGLPNAIATNLIGDPNDPRIVYAGFGAGSGNPPDQLGVYASTDQGRTWSRLGTGLPQDIFSGQLVLDPVNRLLYAGTLGAGVFQIPLL